MSTFGSRLDVAMERRGPLCVGIDPHVGLLERWGLPQTVQGLRSFALTATEALAPVVAAVKPQSAFYERFGSAGIAVLEEVIGVSREAGAQVILDVKRGDIGSTAQGYADAYLRPDAPMYVDAITASPYLGLGSLDPMFDTALANGGGVFVLARTSNPEGASVQGARTDQDQTVAAAILEGLRERNADATPVGSFGAVVGATLPEVDENLAISGPLLVPGLGAQGGTVADLQRLFAGVERYVVPSSSREVLSAGPDPVALKDAARATAQQLAIALGRS